MLMAYLAQLGIHREVLHLSLPDAHVFSYGSREALLTKFGVSEERLSQILEVTYSQ